MSGSAGQMKASLLVTLEDQLSGGLDKITAALDRLNGAIDKIVGAVNKLDLGKPFEKVDENVDKATSKLGYFETRLKGLGETAQAVGRHLDEMFHFLGNSALGRAGSALGRAAQEVGPLGGAAAGFGLLEPVKQYADYENTLRHIAITEGLTDPAKVQAEIERLTRLFAEDAQRTGQSSESIAKAYSDLIQTGIPRAILDRVIGAHSEAATAYNISPEALGPAVGALLQNMKIPEESIGSALSAMAQAAKEGRFKVEDFSREFPGVSGFMSTLGMTGRAGADYGFAALETVMKNASNPSQAAADFTDALNYLTGHAAKLAFARSGIDLPALLDAGTKAGKNPLDTILDKLAEMTKGQDPVKAAEALHAVLHNQQAEQAILALLQHRDEFEALRQKLDAVNASTVQKDFATAVADPITQTRLFTENLEQLQRTIGEGFAPVLGDLNVALKATGDALKAVNEAVPGLLPAIGGFLAFLAVLGAIGFVLPAIGAGFQALGAVLGLVLSPIGAIVALVGAAAYDIYAHWDKFRADFHALWDGLVSYWRGLVDVFMGIVTGDWSRVVQGLGEAWGGLKGVFSAAWDIIKKLFDDFIAFVDGWTNGAATRAIGGIKAAWSGLVDFFRQLWADIRKPWDDFVQSFEGSWLGRHLMGAPAQKAPDNGTAAPAGATVPPAPMRLDLNFSGLPPGVQLTPTGGNTDRVRVGGNVDPAYRTVGRD